MTTFDPADNNYKQLRAGSGQTESLAWLGFKLFDTL